MQVLIYINGHTTRIDLRLKPLHVNVETKTRSDRFVKVNGIEIY
jgi:hypothetical protein